MFANHPHWRMRVIGAVLESAVDADQPAVVMSCRRLIDAHHKGWHRHAKQKDWQLVQFVYDEIVQG